MKSWKLLTGVLFVLLGFCAGVVINFSSINATAQAPPQPPPAALKSVTHDATLTGDGTTTAPLGIASRGLGTTQLDNGAVTAPKLSAAAPPTLGQVLGFNGANLAWQNARVGGVRVVDSRGQVVGPLYYLSSVLRELGASIFYLSVNKNGFQNTGGAFYHTTSDCSEPRYLLGDDTWLSRGGLSNGKQFFFAAKPFEEKTFNSHEYFASLPADPNQPGECRGLNPTTYSAGLVATFDLSTLRLDPPFHLEF